MIAILLIVSIYFNRSSLADEPPISGSNCMLTYDDDGSIIEVCPDDPEWGEHNCPRSCW